MTKSVNWKMKDALHSILKHNKTYMKNVFRLIVNVMGINFIEWYYYPHREAKIISVQ